MLKEHLCVRSLVMKDEVKCLFEPQEALQMLSIA